MKGPQTLHGYVLYSPEHPSAEIAVDTFSYAAGEPWRMLSEAPNRAAYKRALDRLREAGFRLHHATIVVEGEP